MLKRAYRFRASILAIAILTSISGCGGLLEAIGLKNETTFIKRTAPAAVDLPGTAIVAITKLEGRDEDVVAVSAALGELIGESGRFQLVERQRLEELQQANQCEATSNLGCVSQALPASAVIMGTVLPVTYTENVKTDSYDCGSKDKPKRCTAQTRTGTATGSANLRLVEIATGKVLHQALVRGEVTTSTRGGDGSSPESIDSANLLAQARDRMADEFFRAISPHVVLEQVELESDGSVPELGKANDALANGDVDSAVTLYEAGVERAQSAKDASPKVKARAQYGLALGYAAKADFPKARESLRAALALYDEEDWLTLNAKLGKWSTEAEAVAKQLTYAHQASAPDVPPAETSQAAAQQ